MPTPTVPSRYTYAQQVTVTNTSSTAALTGNPTAVGAAVASSSNDYVVKLALTTNTIFTQLTTPPGITVDSSATTDLGVFWWNGTAWPQVDCVIDQSTSGVWSASNLLAWWKLQAGAPLSVLAGREGALQSPLGRGSGARRRAQQVGAGLWLGCRRRQRP